MGREVRKVPENWEHPKKQHERPHGPSYDYMPQHDWNFSEMLAEYEADLRSYGGTAEEYQKEYGDPPERKYYVDYAGQPTTWFQLYETVSEGTPVTPPFATEDELIAYLVECGDFRYQLDIKMGHTIFRSKPTASEVAALVKIGSAPTGMYVDGQMLDSYQCAELASKAKA